MGNEITVTLPDGSSRSLPAGSTTEELASSIGRRLGSAAVAGEVDGALVDLSAPLSDGATVRVITEESPEGREVLRHSTAHVLAQAVCRLWPGTRYAIGPAIADGFYYDFELPGGGHFGEHDLDQIEAEMRAIISEAQPFTREEHSISEGLELFFDQPYKREIIEKVRELSDGEGALNGSDGELASETAAAGGVVSAYRNGEGFVDLCRGPHVGATDRLGHFKLTRVAGAYWRGDEHRPQLQRVYGTAWESDKALAEHLHRLEEAERRDHRRLGLELDLFSFPSEIGSGLAVFHPKGGLVRKVMEDYLRRRHLEAGYEFVYSPHITKAALFEQSGHLEFFSEAMFPPMELDDDQKYYLKPMNCPFHVLIFKSRQRSYRELPLRMFELGTVYRYEKSGVIHGLTRVRGMTQDDAHIFCARDQMAGEIRSLLTFVLDLLGDFGLDDFYLELSTRPEAKGGGSDEEWAEATEALREAASAMSLDLTLDEGGGAFYGPKISVQARDAIGRSWQISTIQVDLQLPKRFETGYVGSDNARHRPVMIHRALFGSIERFFGVLVEHYAGAFPTWLAPVQATVLPVRDDHAQAARSVRDRLVAAGVRAEAGDAGEPLGARIRRAKLEKIPYVLVVGDDDISGDTVGVNVRGSDAPERGVPVSKAVDRIVKDGAEPSRESRPATSVDSACLAISPGSAGSP